jgi:nicotinamidase/pyrazinamidase
MQKNAALLVIDVQPDFCAGGALAVPDGDAVVPVINALAGRFSTVVLTQDWHTPGHASFASSHPGKQPYEMTSLFYGAQVLWPDHCVMGTPGAALHAGLDIPHASAIIRKGSNRGIDSYSAFLEADRVTKTGLDGYFTARSISDLYICGLATDFCVSWSGEDAAMFGFNVTIIEDACRAIDLNGSLASAWARLAQVEARRINSGDL